LFFIVFWRIRFDFFVKIFYQPYLVIPVKTGIQLFQHVMDPAFAGMTELPTFYEIIKFDFRRLIKSSFVADVQMK